jgi:hypothetical protein
MCENELLRKVVIWMQEQWSEKCRMLHNEQLHDICWLCSVVRIVRSSNLQWVRWHGLHTEFWQGRLLKKLHFEDWELNESITLRWILRRWVMRIRGGCNWILRRWVMRIRGGCNWLRIMSYYRLLHLCCWNFEFCYHNVSYKYHYHLWAGVGQSV